MRVTVTNSASAAAEAPPAARLQSIWKTFPGVTANSHVSLDVQAGTFHAVIGENGAGKSTLLNILYGRLKPDRGRIWIAGAEVTGLLNSPADAIRRGVGLVSQHYALIPALTVLENIVLGAEPTRLAGLLNPSAARKRIRQLMEQLQIEDIDLNARAERLSVAAGQKVEIVKALYRGARTLLLDEPTATLAPQEAESLFALLRTLQQNGSTVVFVTHKLREVMAYSDSVSVLRHGQNAGHFVTSQTTQETLLLHMIDPRVGQEARPSSDATGIAETAVPVPEAERPAEPRPVQPGLVIENVSVDNGRGALAVRDVSFNVRAGEIVGVAGVDGSGQRELAECLVGLRPARRGSIRLLRSVGEEQILNSLSVRRRQRLGVAYIPEDRHRVGLALDFSIAENYLLGHETDTNWGGGFLLNRRRLLERANKMIRDYDVRLGSRDARAPARTLSGGNQQKVVIARSLDAAPEVLVACQPTRGLDAEAARAVYATLNRARARGLAILLFSLDLDEIFELSDRLVVMFNGGVAGTMTRSEATPESVGALMTGAASGGGSPPIQEAEPA